MTDFEYQVEMLARDLVLMLMERRQMTMPEALDALYNSDTYQRVRDTHSGLYFQSAGYVYDFLDKELSTGRMQ